ncbi:MAG: hypothetical protein ACWA42_01750 [Lutibacter sp.]
MRKIYIILFLLTPLFIYSQKVDYSCNDLKNGVFELYKADKKIGVIYRKDEYQIEKYFNNKTTTIAKIRHYGCKFHFNAYKISTDLDTITWSVSYKKIKEGQYSFVGKPTYLKIDYTYEGKIVKIKNKINSEILNIFDNLK